MRMPKKKSSSSSVKQLQMFHVCPLLFRERMDPGADVGGSGSGSGGRAGENWSSQLRPVYRYIFSCPGSAQALVRELGWLAGVSVCGLRFFCRVAEVDRILDKSSYLARPRGKMASQLTLLLPARILMLRISAERVVRHYFFRLSIPSSVLLIMGACRRAAFPRKRFKLSQECATSTCEEDAKNEEG